MRGFKREAPSFVLWDLSFKPLSVSDHRLLDLPATVPELANDRSEEKQQHSEMKVVSESCFYKSNSLAQSFIAVNIRIWAAAASSARSASLHIAIKGQLSNPEKPERGTMDMRVIIIVTLSAVRIGRTSW